jgi:hypothetical protein
VGRVAARDFITVAAAICSEGGGLSAAIAWEEHESARCAGADSISQSVGGTAEARGGTALATPDLLFVKHERR